MIAECDSCGFDQAEVKPYEVYLDPMSFTTPPETKHYCELCAATVTSSKSRSFDPSNAILQTICYVGNAIIAEIKK